VNGVVRQAVNGVPKQAEYVVVLGLETTAAVYVVESSVAEHGPKGVAEVKGRDLEVVEMRGAVTKVVASLVALAVCSDSRPDG
jgi:hypothetical protein